MIKIYLRFIVGRFNMEMSNYDTKHLENIGKVREEIVLVFQKIIKLVQDKTL